MSIVMLLIKTYAAFSSIIAFSIIFGMPKNLLKYATIVGVVSWVIYSYLLYIEVDIVLQAFITGLIVAGMSHIFARVLKAPVTIFLVPGILPLVPGGPIYRSVYYFINDNSGLGNMYFTQTLQIAGAIAMSIFIMDSIFRQTRRYTKRQDYEEKKKREDNVKGDY